MFCKVKGLEDLGIGKITEQVGKKFRIEYFDSPGSDLRHAEIVSKTKILPKKLGHNTRVYYHDKTHSKWLVGRVLSHHEEDLEVRFAKKHDLWLNESDLFVRWKKPIKDPTTYLSNLITETPQYGQSRSGFLKSYLNQRASSWGLSSLTSSVIELEPHQIDVVRRVLSDPSQRYLLADEVGLGKTIEAGVIIRQAVLDDPEGHYIVILVPQPIVNQWRQELISKFCLDGFIDESVFILPHVANHEVSLHLNKANLLVVDEAHHVASNATDGKQKELYDMVETVAEKVGRILLLSATPALRNEVGFLRLLHLLDPVAYKIDEVDNFRDKIKNRQSLAETVASLIPENRFQLDWILGELETALPNDDLLKELVSNLKSATEHFLEEDDPELEEAILQLRAHLSETYKLNRRILRNRRKSVKDITPGRNGCTICRTDSTEIKKLEQSIEVWRLNAVSALTSTSAIENYKELSDFFVNMIKLLLEKPWEIGRICQERLNYIRGANPIFSFDLEPKLLKEIVASFDSKAWLRDRLNSLAQSISHLLIDDARIIVYCSDETFAESVFHKLRDTLGESVTRHSGRNSQSLTAQSLNFLSGQNVKALVCDFYSEEGLNFQGGNKIIFNVDLPLSPNRVEQRLGRVDRYGSGNPVHSYIQLDKLSTYQSAWLNVLDKGLGIFNRSIASLQYLVEDKLIQIDANLFESGVEYLELLAEKLGGPNGEVETELKLLDQQDALDELSSPDERSIERISDMEDDWKSIRLAFNHWLVDTLMFQQINLGSDQNQLMSEQTFRFQYTTPGKSGTNTLIPLSSFLEDFIGAIDYSVSASNSKQPRSYPYVYRRNSATKRGVRLLRYGDLFVEASKSFSDIDDRGRSFALWRCFPKIDDASFDDVRLFFCFDFLVQTHLKDAIQVLSTLSTLNTKVAESSLKRKGDSLFPPTLTRIWVDEEGQQPDNLFIQQYLNRPYLKDESGLNEAYYDKNLNLYRLAELEDTLPLYFQNWEKRCAMSRDQARSILVDGEEFIFGKKDALKRAEVEAEIGYAQTRSRIHVLRGREASTESHQLELEKKINEALKQGIDSPDIRIDVVAAFFLSKHSLKEICG